AAAGGAPRPTGASQATDESPSSASADCRLPRRGPGESRPPRLRGASYGSSRLLLDDLRDVFNGLLRRFLSAVAVLDLRLRGVLDICPLREVLQPDGVLLERRERLPHLRRRPLAVAVVRSVDPGRVRARVAGPVGIVWPGG